MLCTCIFNMHTSEASDHLCPLSPSPSPSLSLSLSLYRRRTQSVGNMLDEEGMRPRKYENVTDRELAKQAQLASTQLSRGPKRPPMPLPRPARPEH